MEKVENKYQDNLPLRVTLVCAFRYVLGRKTYAVHNVQQTMYDYMDVLPTPVLETVQRELAEYLKDNDDPQWILFEAHLDNEIKKRLENSNDQSTEEKAD